ncbi:c-type cytochrome [Herminiimonas sp. NPDC097707]|uniref:c-type cytochrome n=1 Tax=Herminiimonas sp. NPDC097707 TaxID=3364007 RepID=UPI00383AAB4C
MVISIVLVVLVVGSVLFHFFSPWRLTPLASNWQQMDDTLAITFVITGIFFIAINFLLVYMLLRFRHREGSRASYAPDNKKLERWLIGGTALAIMALLAPGLFVYAAYIKPPPDALQLEVLGQQWQWRFRFPEQNGKLGLSDARLVSAANPFGLDPRDPAGQNNILINGNEVHLPLNKPVKMLLRSNDVLHDFYVPQFRARMNLVPGMVTSFWFTPTKPGRYEILCAQLCGVGHYNMRGIVVVEDEAAFQAWLKAQPTFAMTMAATGPSAGAHTSDARLEQGRQLAQSKGCVACHSIDGSSGVGPSWKNLFGHTTSLTDGTSVTADEAYLKKSILDPSAQIVKGFPPIMPKLEVSEAELAALLVYIESLSAAGQGGQQGMQKDVPQHAAQTRQP